MVKRYVILLFPNSDTFRYQYRVLVVFKTVPRSLLPGSQTHPAGNTLLYFERLSHYPIVLRDLAVPMRPARSNTTNSSCENQLETDDLQIQMQIPLQIALQIPLQITFESILNHFWITLGSLLDQFWTIFGTFLRYTCRYTYTYRYRYI